MNFHQLRHIAKVGYDSHLCAIRTEREPNRVGCVVRNSERMNVNIADGEMLARLNRLDTLQPLAKRLWKDALHRLHRRFVFVVMIRPPARSTLFPYTTRLRYSCGRW